ncbi:AraC family transcriptional regulator [Lachnoclostridium sp. An181]|uniref:AraC family transcriptional regulator n=1 Tax=Lachnoclostridium sp. An181 TaxID=1965575 RepID=UPI000B3A0D97|nr:AraC family transcriptional regulator [Lachnoclostridium sp. An181]OUP49351.1 AraC family transcriptional regulator [Lachnoclostridium sp. An181]
MPYQRYRLENKESESSRDLTQITAHLLYISQSSYDHDWPSVLHTHHFTELFYVLNGQGAFSIEGKQFPVQEDDLVIVNPNVSHTEYGDGNQKMEYIVLGIDGLQFRQEDQSHYDYSIHNFHGNKAEITFILKTIIHEVQKKEDNFREICQNLLEVLILYLLRRTNDTLSFAPAKKISRECRFIEQYLDEHFSEDISLETLSNLTYMNKYYLVHAFKNYKGVSPINYLITRRIQEAKLLLETSNFSIAKIAQAIGFSSQSYFSQVFRKETGLSPIQYRKKYESRIVSKNSN